MKLNCGDSPETKREKARKQFSLEIKTGIKVFAWWPVRIGDNDCRWLEYVNRKLDKADSDDAFNFYRQRFCRYAKYIYIPID